MAQPSGEIRVEEVSILPRSLEAFRPIVADQVEMVLGAAESIRSLLGDRVVWNVSSTAVGGGVAEMLRSLVGYARGLGVDARWAVIHGDPEFFRITKRLHHALHGAIGDGSPLGPEQRRAYEDTLHQNARALGAKIRPGDVVLLHDPQTAGLGPHLLAAGAHVIWRCHIGSDTPTAQTELGWRFLEPYLCVIPAFVFSRAAYVPAFCNHGKSSIIPPSIDVFSPKNQPLTDAAVRTILVHVGLVEGPPPDPPDYGFLRLDGTPGRVQRGADVIRLGRAPKWETPLVVQVSRWDPLKDMQGVMEGFARMADGSTPGNAELVLAGPNVHAVADDPEGARVFDEVIAQWRALPHATRNRVHLASLPTEDIDENAAVVNALQRHAAIVVQKSLKEGFGLTVTEAMWKSRAVVASAVGGIQDQIEDGKSGLLLASPTDLDELGRALRRLLEDPAEARRLGEAARERVKQCFLGLGHLLRYAELIGRVAGTEQSAA